MKSKVASIVLLGLLSAACAREQTNSQGNGPGNADGVGGRQDPVTAPTTEGGAGAPQGDANNGGQNGTESTSSQPSTPPQSGQ